MRPRCVPCQPRCPSSHFGSTGPRRGSGSRVCLTVALIFTLGQHCPEEVLWQPCVSATLPPRARAALARGGALAAMRVSHAASPRARAALARGGALAAACLTVALTLALGQLRPEEVPGSRACQPHCPPRALAAPARGGALAAPARGGALAAPARGEVLWQPHVSATLPLLVLGQLRPEEVPWQPHASATVPLLALGQFRPEEVPWHPRASATVPPRARTVHKCSPCPVVVRCPPLLSRQSDSAMPLAVGTGRAGR
jgi:hypothetical protein